MPTASEILHRLPMSLSMFGGILVLQFLVAPLSRGTGGWRWLIVGAYLLLLLIVVTYFGVRARAYERRFHRESQRRQPRQAPAGPTDLAG